MIFDDTPDNISYEPKFRALIDAYDAEIENAEYRISLKHSKRFLAYYRKKVAKFKLHNHKLQLECAMGSCCVRLSGEVYYGTGRTPEFDDLITSIHQSMNWDWAYLLDGELLNLDYNGS